MDRGNDMYSETEKRSPTTAWSRLRKKYAIVCASPDVSESVLTARVDTNCLASLLQCCCSCKLVVHDDSSLRDFQKAQFERLFPHYVLVDNREIERKLEAFLPAEKFPVLRARRLVYPHLRKLTDVHIGGSGWKLVLDSDMLFFKRPHVLLDWLRSPDMPCYMRHIQTSWLIDVYCPSKSLI